MSNEYEGVTDQNSAQIEARLVIDDGPIHHNTHDLETGVSTFTHYDPEKCRKSPDGEHDWSGPWVEDGMGGEGSSCAHCGLDFGSFAMRCLP